MAHGGEGDKNGRIFEILEGFSALYDCEEQVIITISRVLR